MKIFSDNTAGGDSAPVLDPRVGASRHRQLAVRLVLGLAVYFLVYKLVAIFALSSVARIVVEMGSDHDTLAAVYYSSNLRKTAFQQDQVKRLILQAGPRKTHNFDLDNRVVKAIRFDPGTKPGTYRLYALAPSSFYGKIEPIDLFAETTVEPGPGTTVVKKDDHLEIIAETDDPYLLFHQEIKAENPTLLLLTPLLVALIVVAGCTNFRLTACAFWVDTIKKSPSGGQNYDALDGMRGLAALFVLAAHTGVAGCNSLGHVGVDFFFSLSGFLLCLPYAENGSLILSNNVGKYYLRRLKRIVPMFYFILAITYLFNGRIDVFLRSALFLQGNTIYWTVLQEIHFYIFLPAILLINHLVLRNNRLLIAGLLLVLSYGFNHGLLTTYGIFGLGQKMAIFAGLFLSGIMVSYLCRIDGVRNSRGLQRVLANPLIGCVLLVAIFGIEQLWAITHDGQVRNSSWLMSGNFNYLVAVLILLLVLAPHSLPGRLFNTLPLRIMGTVSYSFYLLHPICLGVVKAFALEYLGHSLGALGNFLYTLVLTFVLATVTYRYIERPFIRANKPAGYPVGQQATG